MATTGSYAIHEIVVEPLSKENLLFWSEWVRNYLIARDLWEVIDGTFERLPEEDEDFVRWRRMNASALHVIQISCTPEALSIIKGFSEAKSAWHILHINYSTPLPQLPPQLMGGSVNFDVRALYEAICNNNWVAAKAIIDEHPSHALNAILNSDGQTALHVAVKCGHEAIAEELVTLVPPEYLQIQDVYGFTPLAIAAAVGEGLTRVAECMVNKNSNILSIPIPDLHIPVALAFSYGHKEMGRYLYSLTPLECLTPDKVFQGPWLLYWCFYARELDVAVDLLQQCQELLFAKTPDGWTPIGGIATMSSAFPSGTKLVFWKRWIYNYINIQSTSINSVRVDIQQQSQSGRVQGFGLVQRIISHTYDLLGTKEIYEMKLLHAQAAQILRLICNNITAIDGDQQNIVANALFSAAKEGIVEFVSEVSKANPQLVFHSQDSSCRHTFFYAMSYRQAEVFNLIHETRFKNALASRIVDCGNSMLHEAGMLVYSTQLNRISGAVLQMQSELQWFKEVESVVPLGFREKPNNYGMKAEDIFKEKHRVLRKEGETWMKETASSCSVVGALVVTIMFAAAFTVPGGNNQDFGYPIFLEDKLFLLFIISDALSLFSSTTSVLMFLGILTSRYAEEDFLISLPRKLIIGLSTLFFSIATMMISFSACILIMLQHTYSWALLPIILLASVPITIFELLQFPLLVQMISSTYGPGKFKKKVKSRS